MFGSHVYGLSLRGQFKVCFLIFGDHHCELSLGKMFGVMFEGNILQSCVELCSRVRSRYHSWGAFLG